MSDSRDQQPRRRHGQDDTSDVEMKESNRRSDREYRNDSSRKDRPSGHRRDRDRDYSSEDDRSSQHHTSRRGDYESREPNSRHRDRKPRERSRSRDHRRHTRSRSPPTKRRRRSPSDSRSPKRDDRQSRAPLPSQAESFPGNSSNKDHNPDGPAPVEKQKPNYKPTGLLAKEANTIAGTTSVLKYHEPAEARKPPPKEQWRMYVFKQKETLDTVYLHERSVWLVGRDKNVTDLLLEHPSISKQHAVVQFRYLSSTNEFGDRTGRVRPYLLDLESANGTLLNGERVEARRFVELVDGDVVRFGESEREYVLMLPPLDK